jgi:hypothetical protein
MTAHDSGALKLRKLERNSGIKRLGKHARVVLPNSIRSTIGEIERLQAEEFARTGIDWEIVDA